jgi:hypothetical protein
VLPVRTAPLEPRLALAQLFAISTRLGFGSMFASKGILHLIAVFTLVIFSGAEAHSLISSCDKPLNTAFSASNYVLKESSTGDLGGSCHCTCRSCTPMALPESAILSVPVRPVASGVLEQADFLIGIDPPPIEHPPQLS